jgi:glycosyltransferase involved in cell wall biosynthesis
MPDQLRILYIAYSLLPVSERSCGGAEQALLLVQSQMRLRGHDTVVAACSGSQVSGELFATGEAPNQPDGFEVRDAEHIENIIQLLARQQARPFDLIHDHGGSFCKYAARVDVPVLATLHLPRHFYAVNSFSELPPNLFINCVSESQAQTLCDVPQVAGVVRNGIDVERLSFTNIKQDYLLWLGRICPEKGTHLALDVARKAGVPVVIAGDIYPFTYHQDYFRREVVPRIHALQETARLMAGISFEEKLELLGHARAVLIPSLVDETSSLVAMEAMACGTPVICLRRGALPEVVTDRVTGLVVDSPEEMVEAIAHVTSISPAACRQHVVHNFGAARMADEYEHLYRKVIASIQTLPSMEA